MRRHQGKGLLLWLCMVLWSTHLDHTLMILPMASRVQAHRLALSHISDSSVSPPHCSHASLLPLLQSPSMHPAFTHRVWRCPSFCLEHSFCRQPRGLSPVPHSGLCLSAIFLEKSFLTKTKIFPSIKNSTTVTVQPILCFIFLHSTQLQIYYISQVYYYSPLVKLQALRAERLTLSFTFEFLEHGSVPAHSKYSTNFC